MFAKVLRVFVFNLSRSGVGQNGNMFSIVWEVMPDSHNNENLECSQSQKYLRNIFVGYALLQNNLPIA